MISLEKGEELGVAAERARDQRLRWVSAASFRKGGRAAGKPVLPLTMTAPTDQAAGIVSKPAMASPPSSMAGARNGGRMTSNPAAASPVAPSSAETSHFSPIARYPVLYPSTMYPCHSAVAIRVAGNTSDAAPPAA
jgi:hypothetical protein